MATEVYDPYDYKTKWENLKGDLNSCSKKNRILIDSYLKDMELGLNVKSVKGKRSYSRLVTLRYRMKRLDELTREMFDVDFINLTDRNVAKLFNDMREGKIKKRNGQPFKSTADYIKVFKAFWNWFMRVSKKKGRVIPNIVEDISSTYDRKPEFTYFTFDEMKKMANHS